MKNFWKGKSIGERIVYLENLHDKTVRVFVKLGTVIDGKVTFLADWSHIIRLEVWGRGCVTKFGHLDVVNVIEGVDVWGSPTERILTELWLYEVKEGD